ncbi:ArsC family reductase [Ramlibacter sp.]|uniref:ArsC family reductase n=1 Tax=Ramlibacter sp. TaxID=1917967 RepID=UPI003D0BF92B
MGKDTSITVYGIPNCDTVKKARAWLAEHGVAHTFHDFKKQGVPEAELDAWLRDVGWEKVLNRKGTMWRKLDAQTQASVVDAKTARSVMLAQPSVIKRPVVAWASGKTTVGFDAAAWPSLAGL